MNYFLNDSLTYRASVAVISSIWNEDDIIASIHNRIYEKNMQQLDYIDHISSLYTFENSINLNIIKLWTEVENNVLLKLRKLEIPATLKGNLVNFVQPMGKQILTWIMLTVGIFRIHPKISKSMKFVWTETGILDYSKSTMFVIEHNSNNMLRFHLASIFFMEDVIMPVWPYIKQEFPMGFNQTLMDFPFVYFWFKKLNGETLDLVSEYFDERNAPTFECLLLHKRSVCSLNYFLHQTQPEKRQKVAVNMLKRILKNPTNHNFHGNLILSLFSYIDESAITEIVKEYCFPVLTSLLEWPCHNSFLTIADSSWEYLSNGNYIFLFLNIVEYISLYNMGNLYRRLIKQFWHISPSSFKNYVIYKCMHGSFLSRIFHHENTDDIVQIIFNDCNEYERQQIIFYFESMNICDFLVKKQKWESLSFFVKSCISSHTVSEEFIECYKKFEPNYSKEERHKRTDILLKKIREWY